MKFSAKIEKANAIILNLSRTKSKSSTEFLNATPIIFYFVCHPIFLFSSVQLVARSLSAGDVCMSSSSQFLVIIYGLLVNTAQ